MRFVLAGLLFIGCALYGAPVAATVAGMYQTEGGFESTTLELLPDGSYTARLDLDVFPEAGHASGVWRLDGDEIVLTPKTEEGRLKDYLRVLVMRTTKDRKMLLRKEDAKDETSNPYARLYLQEGHNKSVRRAVSANTR